MKYFVTFFVLLHLIFSNAHAREAVQMTQNKWEVLQYSGIKANQVNFNNNTMTIKVNQSAGPLVYRLNKPQVVKEIILDADILGKLKLNKSKQGEKGNDDFSLRVGLVYQGKRRLGFMQKQVAAGWIKKLFSLAPKNLGVSHVEFFTVFQDKRLANSKRVHPLSDLLVENFTVQQPNNGKLKVSFKVPSNKTALAVWISSDGDDTKSAYSVRLNQLILN